MNDLTLKLRLIVENGQFKVALTDSLGQVAGLGRGATSAGQQMESGLARGRRGLVSISEQLGQARTQLLAFLGTRELVRFASQLVSLSDTYQSGNARLKLFTATQEEYNVAQRETFEVAQRTRTGLQDTITLYGKVAESVRGLGGDQAQALQITESVNQALQVSGAGTVQQASAITQFTQALAGGILRAEEFNSILENAPRLAQALADGLEVPRGALRGLVNDGQVSAEQMVRAILSQRDILETEFNTLPLTVASAMTKVRNEFERAVGQNLGQSTGQLAQVISTISENLAGALSAAYRGVLLVATAVGVQLLASLQAGSAGLLQKRQATVLATQALAQERLQLIGNLQAEVASLDAKRIYTAALLKEAQAAVAAAAGMQRLTVAETQLVPAQRAAAAAADAHAAAEARLGAAMKTQRVGMIASIRQAGLLRSAIAGIGNAFQLLGGALIGFQIGSYLHEQFATARLAGSFLTQGLLEIAEAAKFATEATKAAFNDDTVAAALSRYEARAAQLRDVFVQQRKDIRSGLDQSQADAPVAPPAASLDFGSASGAGGTESAAEKADDDAFKHFQDMLRKELELQGEQADLVRDLKLAQLKAEGRDYEANLEALKQEYEGWLETLSRSAEGTALAQKVFDTAKARLLADELERQARELVDGLNRRSGIRDRQAEVAGPARAAQLSQDNEADFGATLESFERIAQAANDVSGSTGEKLRETLAGIAQDMEALQPPASEWMQTLLEIGNIVTGELQTGFQSAFKGLLDGSRSVSDSFKSLASSVVESIQQMIAKTLAFYAVQQLVGLVPGASLSSNGILTLDRADGGYISGPGGPRSDSIPARLSNGEYVIQASSVQKFGRGFFDALNAGLAPPVAPMAFANGGFVGPNPASSAGGLSLQVINQGEPMKVSRTEQSRGPSGQDLYRVFVEPALKRDIAQGGDVIRMISGALGTERVPAGR